MSEYTATLWVRARVSLNIRRAALRSALPRFAAFGHAPQTGAYGSL